MRTKLPKKWCIKITKENLQVLDSWRTHKGCLRERELGELLMYPGYKNVIGYCTRTAPGIEEITFEEFTHFILKEKPPKENYKYLTTFLRKLNIT